MGNHQITALCIYPVTLAQRLDRAQGKVYIHQGYSKVVCCKGPEPELEECRSTIPGHCHGDLMVRRETIGVTMEEAVLKA